MTEKEMNSYVKERLFALQDETYKQFHSRLMPTIEPEKIIGVRTPLMRKLAKDLKKDAAFDEYAFMKMLPHDYYEENNLHGFFLEMEKDYDALIEQLDAFLPYVDNWATCDLISPKLLKKHPDGFLEKIKEWIRSEQTYTIRFGIEMLMSYYLDEAFLPEYLLWVAEVKSEEYYVNMMIAWYFATALAKQYEQTLPILLEERLDIWTHNKTIQKAVESYRITDEQKQYLRTLRKKQVKK